ncbi:MAG: N-acetyltransferase DgcN [Paracoccaceae bacterium]
MIKTPYLLFLGDAPDQLAAKVAQGIRDWRPDISIGQIKLPGCKADLNLKNYTLEEAKENGARTLIIGVANRGGKFSDSWKKTLCHALELKFDIASGLHNLLSNEKDLLNLSEVNECNLIDVRIPKEQFPIGNGKKRTGKRCLTIGTDCSVGKMYSSLAIEKEMRSRKMKVSFRATGQTGILISGRGIPLDAIVADFMAGSVEALSPDNDDDHWDIIEGQGSLFHVSYSGVTMALIHGGQPDHIILCHEPTRAHMRGLPHYDLPTLEALYEIALPLAKISNPNCKISGICINTKNMERLEGENLKNQIEQAFKLPTVDPFIDGTKKNCG